MTSTSNEGRDDKRCTSKHDLNVGRVIPCLAGTVERDAVQRLLEGRHPVTGARLVTARASSQRGHLAVGSAARFDEHGDPVY